MRQIVAIVLRDFEGLVLDAVIKVLRERRAINKRSTEREEAPACGSGCGCGCGSLTITHTPSAQSNPHPEELLRQISALIDASVHGDKSLHGGLVPDVGVVQAGIQHDDSKGQHIAGI